ncbi:MAG: flavin reductase [Clostridiales bacterium]|jgi:flavorubredoxin/flavin reductase (DIM6/NTAB) family NADH-FMN oxidoreductase RutF|nr:flavin reductase [Clostridiales bacterium]
MYKYRKIADNLYWVGSNDRRLMLFENLYPVPNGVSYNCYLSVGEVNILFDTVHVSAADNLICNLQSLLPDGRLDYVIVNHMEPDHSGTLSLLLHEYPNVKIICNEKTLTIINRFFKLKNQAVLVNDGEQMTIGGKTYVFVTAPMVHWPEVMVTYNATDKYLFSADAFGTFGALGGSIFADELNFETDILPEARRYYCNIVGKYGAQVTALLQKASELDIKLLLPLHGPVWRRDIPLFVNKYVNWACYKAEENTAVIFYASIYGNTETAAEILSTRLAEKGVGNVKLYDVSVTDPSYLLAEAFRAKTLVFAAPTHNAGLFRNMETFLTEISSHNLQNRSIAFIGNGTWGPLSQKIMPTILAKNKNFNLIGEPLIIESAVKAADLKKIDALAAAIAADLTSRPDVEIKAGEVDPSAMFKLSYGLFVLTSQANGKDNGCIINTCTQITDNPKRISIAVNKANLTCEQIQKTGVFNVSVFSEKAVFDQFKHFGFQSGRNTDKFADMLDCPRSANGLYYITENCNAFISGKVIDSKDYGTHILFIADVVESKTISGDASTTYQYYFENIKPKPVPKSEPRKGYICKICGYFHEGDLPEDFICPLCKHGVEDFEPAEM